MKKSLIYIWLLLLSVSLFGNDSILPKKNIIKKDKLTIYTFEIMEEIAPPAWRKTKEAFEEAEKINADIIIIQMNTFGGALDAADKIRTRILESKIPVYVFIDNNAASAGALISIACDSIYMRKGASIGAATVVNQTGEVLPDKYQSYMRSMMRSTAETNGRNPEIAEAMVDPSVFIEGIIDSGKVLTFTTTEAIKYKYCEGTAETIRDVLKASGIKNYEIKKQYLSPLDYFIDFLINPIVSGILIMVIIGGIYFELQTPGIGFPLIAALTAAALYFAPLYLEGLASHWEILVFLVGLILLALEVFVIPGFGVAGISGIFLIIIGLTLSLIGNVGFDFTGVPMNGIIKSLITVIISIFLGLIGSFYFGRKVLTSNIFGHLALETVQNSNEGFTASYEDVKQMIGKKGIAYTILRPAGKIMIDNDLYDATALNGFIDKGELIEVVKYETSSLFVKKV
jgi:membrane-bound serine protease (ClpP class)